VTAYDRSGMAPQLRDATAEVSQLWDDYSAFANDTPPPDSPEYVARRRAFVHGANMMRKRVLLGVLQGIARRRPLDDVESAVLDELAGRLARNKRPVWRWTAAEDARLVRLIRKREREGRPKPYQRNDAVARLARDLGRSYFAVHRRMERLRAALKAAANVQTRPPAPGAKMPGNGEETEANASRGQRRAEEARAEAMDTDAA